MGTFSFSRAERIRSRKEFQGLKAKGSVFKTRKLVFNFAATAGPSRLGVVATKKMGNAVFRNRVKRWLREAFRLNKQALALPMDLVVVPRVSELSFAEIEQDLRFFQQWHREKHEKSARRPH